MVERMPRDWMAELTRRLVTVRMYRRIVGVGGLTWAVRGELTHTQSLRKVVRDDVRQPFYLRVPSSDVPTYEQIFLRRDYAFDAAWPPRTIIDAGANIGLASIWFASRYPRARIVAIEPEEGNYEMLKRNVAGYASITPVRAALWHENRKLNLVDPHLGDWGFMTEAGEETGAHYGEMRQVVDALTVDAIMREHRMAQVDLLKIDIEGAEREVFEDPSAWIGGVGALIVELHERMKAGCNRSFYRATEGFDDEWWQGENVYLARRGSCLERPGGGGRLVTQR